jgi:hypothetical protein
MPDSADLRPEFLSEATHLRVEYVDSLPERLVDRFYQVIQSLVEFRPERPHLVHGPFRPWGHGCEATKSSPFAGAFEPHRPVAVAIIPTLRRFRGEPRKVRAISDGSQASAAGGSGGGRGGADRSVDARYSGLFLHPHFPLARRPALGQARRGGSVAEQPHRPIKKVCLDT